MTEKPSKNALEVIKENWFIVLFIGGMVLTWGRFEFKVNNQETRLAEVESSQKAADSSYVDLRVQLAEIKVSLDYIKDKVAAKP